MKNYIFSFLLIVLRGGMLFSQNTPRLVLPVGQSSSSASEFSPDSKYLICSDESGLVTRIFETGSGRELKEIQGQLSYVANQSSFSPDGKWMATACDTAVFIWDVTREWNIKKVIRIRNSFPEVILHPPFSIRYLGNSMVILDFYPFEKNTLFGFDLFNEINPVCFKGHIGQVHSVLINQEGKKLLTASADHSVREWELKSGIELLKIYASNNSVLKANYSFDDKLIMSVSTDNSVRIFEANSGYQLQELKHHGFLPPISAAFSPNADFVFTTDEDTILHFWEVKSGKEFHKLKINNKNLLKSTSLSFQNNRIKKILNSKDSLIKCNPDSLEELILRFCSGNRNISPDGSKKIDLNIGSYTTYAIEKEGDYNLFLSDRNQKKERKLLSGFTTGVKSVDVLNGENSICAAFNDSTVRFINLLTGKTKSKVKFHLGRAYKICLSPDGSKILAALNDNTIRIFDAISGIELFLLVNRAIPFYDICISPDGKFASVIAESPRRDASLRIFEMVSGKQIFETFSIDPKWNFQFTPDSKKILCQGKYLITIKTELISKISETGSNGFAFSPDGKTIIKMDSIFDFEQDGKLQFADIETGKIIRQFSIGKFRNVKAISCSQNGKYLLMQGNFGFNVKLDNKRFKASTSATKSIKIWDAESGKELNTLRGFNIKKRLDACFVEDGKYIVTWGDDHQTILWETATGRKLYTRLQLKGDDYLIYDEHYRFDGTPGAMEKLYFVCGLETTELGQMKDALYVPGLAEKIIRGEEINYKKLSDLDFCNALPLLELQKEDPAGRELRIQQRRWPLKQLDIKVRGKTVRSIPAEKLGFIDNQVSLQISNAGMEKYLLAGIDNEVELQALCMDKGSEFRSQSIKFSLPGPKSKPQPKLFLLLIGVNDYKDDDLDLNFPVQDARALGNALEQSAAKLLGKENVETYHVQSRLPGQQVYTTPERAGIMKALEEIGRKARTQDVLFIFFAGHGVMQTSGEKAFTFLTADASRLSQVGISTKDLKEWLSPEGPFAMMPNKTILVYDACNSGQAAKELVSVLTRDNDATERRRQIEDLGDKSGLFILSASAPDKPAYEVQGLGQGLLTYSMLYTLKNNPLILDENVEGNGFLNLQKWFLETEREQNRLMSSLGLKQKAQPYGSANIRIGMVDEEVRKGIKLKEEKPLVYCASARNENEEDPLDLKNQVNDYLENGQARGIQSDVAFVPSETPQTNVVKLIYKSGDKKVNCRILIFRNKQKILEQNLEAPEPELVKNIVAKLERVCK